MTTKRSSAIKILSAEREGFPLDRVPPPPFSLLNDRRLFLERACERERKRLDEGVNEPNKV